MKTVIFVTNIDDGLIGKTICGYQLRKVYTGSSDRSELLTATMYSWEFANSLFLENDRETGCLQEPATNKTVRVDSFLQKDLSGSYYFNKNGSVTREGLVAVGSDRFYVTKDKGRLGNTPGWFKVETVNSAGATVINWYYAKDDACLPK